MVVDRLKGVKNLDINSGFDDTIFVQDPERYWKLYRQLDIEGWRLAYDQPKQLEPMTKCTEFLHSKGIDYRHITVFCLVGFKDTFDAARKRLQYLIDIGTSPYPQRFKPLDCLTKEYDPEGWDPGQIDLLFGYYSPPGQGGKWKSKMKDGSNLTWEGYLAGADDRPQPVSLQGRMF
jgi:hypothetical protein